MMKLGCMSLSYNKPVITSVNPRPFDSRGSLDEQPVQLVLYGRNFGPYINDDDDNQALGEGKRTVEPQHDAVVGRELRREHGARQERLAPLLRRGLLPARRRLRLGSAFACAPRGRPPKTEQRASERSATLLFWGFLCHS